MRLTSFFDFSLHQKGHRALIIAVACPLGNIRCTCWPPHTRTSVVYGGQIEFRNHRNAAHGDLGFLRLLLFPVPDSFHMSSADNNKRTPNVESAVSIWHSRVGPECVLCCANDTACVARCSRRNGIDRRKQSGLKCNIMGEGLVLCTAVGPLIIALGGELNGDPMGGHVNHSSMGFDAKGESFANLFH